MDMHKEIQKWTLIREKMNRSPGCLLFSKDSKKSKKEKNEREKTKQENPCRK
jgi:hypothetical protein